jgi:tetratricopeptide (TPR) repeat protein
MQIGVLKHKVFAGMAWSLAVALSTPGCGARRSEQYRLEGDAYLEQGNVADAAESYGESLALNAGNAQALLGMGRCLLAQERPDDALRNFREAINAAPSLEAPYGEAVHVLLKKGQHEEAGNLAQGLEKLNPEQGGLLRATVLDNSGRKDEGLQLLTTLQERFPASSAVQSALAEARSATRQLTPGGTLAAGAPDHEDWRSLWNRAALITLVESRETFLAESEVPNLRECLMFAALLTHNSAAADEVAAKLPAESPFQAYLSALKNGDWERVLTCLEQRTDDSADRQILAENARAYAQAQAGMRAQAIGTLSRCLERWPENAVSLLGMAEVFRSAGMPEFAVRALQRLISQYPETMTAHISLYGTLRAANMLQEARNAAEVAYRIFPKASKIILNLADAYLATKELDRARQVLVQGLTETPADENLKLALAEVLIRSDKCGEAQSLLQDLDTSSPESGRAAMVLAFCSAFSGDWDSVAQWGEAANPESLETPARLLLASSHIRSGQREIIIDLLNRPGKSCTVGGHSGKIILTALGRPVPDMQEDETALAGRLAQDNGALADFAFGAACQAAQFHGEAVNAFESVDKAVEGSPVTADLYFTSLVRREHPADPEDEAQAFARQHSSMPQAWLGLADVEMAAGDQEAEIKALDQAVAVAPADGKTLLRRGQLRERRGNSTGAIADYQRVLELEPEDAAANNNLAYCLLTTGGDPQEALRAAERAAELWHENPHVLHTLGMAQLRTGALELSQKSLTVALEMRPGDPTFLLDYGQLLLALKQNDEGANHIKLALRYADQLGLDFPRRAEAESVVNSSLGAGILEKGA